MKIRALFQSISFTVTLTIGILVTVLFGLFAWQLVRSSEKAFVDVVTVYSVQGVVRQNAIGQRVVLPVPKFFPAVIPRAEPREKFKQQIVQSLIWGSAAAILGAVGIGVIVSVLIQRRTKSFSDAVRSLREKRDMTRLPEDTALEFQSLSKEFNEFADELQKAENLRKQLISDTSHELRTPLTSLQAQLEGVRDGVVQMDTPRVETLLRQVAQLTELVNGLQEYARLRSNALHLKKEDVQLSHVVREVVDSFLVRAGQKGISIVQDVSSEVRLQADKRLLVQAVTAIINNVFVHAQASLITIRGDARQLVIADNGVGVPQDKLQYLFERFYRTDESRSKESGGLGLGLAIAKESVEAHGWTLTAAQGEDGKGLVMTIGFGN